MAKRRTMQAGATQAPERLPKRPDDTQTAWEDPWAAARKARQELEEKSGEKYLPHDAHTVGRRITEEINADPEEVDRLRKARQDARAGKIFPRHADTKSD
jgi:hypothetical protein